MTKYLDLNWIDIGFKRIQEALGVKLFPTYWFINCGTPGCHPSNTSIGVTHQHHPSVSPTGVTHRCHPLVSPIGITHRCHPTVSPTGVNHLQTYLLVYKLWQPWVSPISVTHRCHPSSWPIGITHHCHPSVLPFKLGGDPFMISDFSGPSFNYLPT